jgi:hypothetical protein
MALVLADRVKETSGTTGTGDISLAGATTGFQRFADTVGDGNTTYYAISLVGGGQFEVGRGTYISATNSITRDEVFDSSNNGSLVDFGTGTKDVFVVYPSDRAVAVDGSTVNIPNSATVPVSGGGTGASSESSARSNLGLGTISTQDANNVNLDGGSISGTDVDVSGATFTVANDQISGDAINGGTATPTALNVDSGTLFVDSANNRVGIGTSSPDEALHVEGNIEADRIQLYSDGNSISGRYYGGLYYNGNDQIVTFNSRRGNSSSFIIGNAVKHKTDADGFVSTANNINWGRGAFETGNFLKFASRAPVDAPIGTDVDLNTRFLIANNGDISFYEDTGTTPKFFWDASAERLGIRTSSPQRSLEVDNGAVIRSESDSFENESPVIYIERGNRTFSQVGIDRGHFISARSDNSLGLQDNFIAFNIHDGTDTDSTIKSLQITGTGDIIVDGGVYLGGTGSANKLDDYETGTWTPATESGTVGVRGAAYVKVGSKVTVSCTLHNFSDTSTVSGIEITGLPFTSSEFGEEFLTFTGIAYGERFDDQIITPAIETVTSTIRLRNGVGSGGFADVRYADINNGPDAALRFTITYFTDS